MTTRTFRLLLVLWAALFALLFVVIVIPPLIGDPDLLAAITAGFVNPYALALIPI